MTDIREAADTPGRGRAAGRRGRPTRSEERSITLAILEAGLRLFLENGYGATSMKSIGEAANVAPNTLYARFATKEDLFRAITEWKVALWKATIRPRTAPPATPLREAMEVALLGLFEAMEREDISAIGRLLMLETARFPELAAIYHGIATSVGRDGLVQTILQSPDVELSEEQASDMAITLLEAAIGHTHMGLLSMGAGFESRERAAKRIAAFCTQGVPPPPGPAPER